ncbi:helix-hairpin-helix domain-containing protein [Comamonas sp.]|uniref:helix-hairpin-helix domain-containing protein n=1 Tax=Comamonas sp. TaxID=34028 RepID=UPI00289943AE|nr:helix-hairpin-helix domain-containing protein [Comamonas sp.]
MFDAATLKPEMSLVGLLPSIVTGILAKNGVHTIDELQKAYPYRLLTMRGMGMLRLKEIETALFPGQSFVPQRIRSPILHVRGSSLNGVLTPATVRALGRGGVTTAEQLLGLSSNELLKCPGLGASNLRK